MSEILTPEQAEQALRTWIRDHRKDGCRVLSKGAACDCGLCLLDIVCGRNTAELGALRAALAEAERQRDELEGVLRATVNAAHEQHRLVAAERDAAREQGRQEILRGLQDIEALRQLSTGDWRCQFCGAEGEEIYETKHAASCLWALAHATPPETQEG